MVEHNSPTVRHFLDLHELSGDDLRVIINFAIAHKEETRKDGELQLLPGKQLAMIFEKPSTRTRVSFEVGINQLGGRAIILDAQNSQLGRGETVADTARVMSRYVDMVMIRCYEHTMLTEFAKYSSVPVINGLSNFSHPCQVVSDIMTFEEHRSTITGKKVAWIGDGNNMAHSWIHAAVQLGFTLHIAGPKEFAPYAEVLAWAKEKGADVQWMTNPADAVQGADLISTDTWTSMGSKDQELRKKLLAPYQVNEALMAHADKNALFMHCLPAHRGEEVTDAVLDGTQSVVWDEAENRLHAQKAIMVWCLGNI